MLITPKENFQIHVKPIGRQHALKIINDPSSRSFAFEAKSELDSHDVTQALQVTLDKSSLWFRVK